MCSYSLVIHSPFTRYLIFIAYLLELKGTPKKLSREIKRGWLILTSTRNLNFSKYYGFKPTIFLDLNITKCFYVVFCFVAKKKKLIVE